MRWSLVFAWGCGATANPTDTAGTGEDCPDVAFGFTPGFGEVAFAPLVDQQEATIVKGPQGGWHLWTAGKLSGAGPTVTLVTSIVVVENGLVVAAPNDSVDGENAPRWLDLTTPGVGTYDAESCDGTFYGLETRLDDFAVPTGGSVLDIICALNGRALDFTFEVTDVASGQTAAATVQVIGRPDTETAEACQAAH